MPVRDRWAMHLGDTAALAGLEQRLTTGALAECFSKTAAEVPDSPALTVGDTSLSHGRLDDHAARVAGWLKQAGLEPGQRVILTGAGSVAFVISYIAILRVGATVVPCEAGSTENEFRRLLNAAEPAAAIADRDSLDRITAAAGAGLTGYAIDDPQLGPELTGLEAEPAPVVAAQAPAMLAYTSGTTGDPKGVTLSHANLLASIRAAMEAWRWQADDVLVHSLPLSHQHGLSGVHTALLAGSHTVVLPRLDPDLLIDAVERHRGTVLFAVPAIYERLDSWGSERLSALSRLRLATCGSAPLAAQLAQRVAGWLGQIPLERYGSTEAGLVLSNPYDGPRLPGSVGYPLPGIEVRLVDEQGEDVAVGEPGEIVIRGPQVFSGYTGPAQLTEDAFFGEWFRSGDIGVQSPGGGEISITGRAKEMIITGGLNVFPAEIEAVISELPEVGRCAVAGVPSPRWGEEVVALVVAEPGHQPAADQILARCRRDLSAYKCPKRVFTVEDLPLTSVGKVRRDRVAELAAELAAETEQTKKER